MLQKGYYDKEKPVSNIFISPSITTFATGNPSFRVYYMDPDNNLFDYY